MSINSFINKNIINIYFIVSTFILGILCFLISTTAWNFFRGAQNCNVRNPSQECKNKSLISRGKMVPIVLLIIGVYFVYIRVSSIYKGVEY